MTPSPRRPWAPSASSSGPASGSRPLPPEMAGAPFRPIHGARCPGQAGETRPRGPRCRRSMDRDRTGRGSGCREGRHGRLRAHLARNINQNAKPSGKTEPTQKQNAPTRSTKHCTATNKRKLSKISSHSPSFPPLMLPDKASNPSPRLQPNPNSHTTIRVPADALTLPPIPQIDSKAADYRMVEWESGLPFIRCWNRNRPYLRGYRELICFDLSEDPRGIATRSPGFGSKALLCL